MKTTDTTSPGGSRKSSVKSSTSSRRPSKFLEGTAIPNSVIKAQMDLPDQTPKTKEALRKERDEFVAEVLHTAHSPYQNKKSLFFR